VNQLDGYGGMGAYNAVMRVKQIPEGLLAVLVAPIIPILSESFGKGDRAGYRTTLRHFFTMSVLVSVPFALVLVAAPEWTLKPFGSDYAGNSGIVIWVMLNLIVTSLGSTTGYLLVTVGRNWLLWMLSLLYPLALAPLAFYLVPRHGAQGFAAALCMACLISTVPSIVVLFRSYPEEMKFIRWLLMTTAVAGMVLVCMALHLWVPAPFNAIIGIGAGAGFVFAVVRIFGTPRRAVRAA
jgi:O-antigen/teichoic acid export membrane protein